MLESCIYRGQKLDFHTRTVDPDGNIFTTIVGRNGSGKSRFLRELVNSFAEVNEPRRERELKEISSLSSLIGTRPKNIIASSTSPFDKFPIPYGKVGYELTHDNYYFYQGLRGLGHTNLSLAFMSRTLGFLIKALSSDRERVGTVMEVLDYLGYQEFVVARFVLDVPRDFMTGLISAPNPTDFINNFLGATTNILGVHGRKLRTLLDSITSEEDIYNLRSALRDFMGNFGRPRIDAVISGAGAVDAISGKILTRHFTVLLDMGLLRLRDVTLKKKDVADSFTITDASSGEQCVLMALMGIAANIKDGSLVCIDEPEICLHPEWQERYIKLLMKTFSGFKGCHFIIATHSPQIISKLADDNCFVLDIQTGRTIDARDLNNRSADFQLARIFGAPGFKNEYLTREILNALTILGAGRSLSEERLAALEDLLKLKEILEEDDPVRDLLTLLEGAMEAKANG